MLGESLSWSGIQDFVNRARNPAFVKLNTYFIPLFKQICFGYQPAICVAVTKAVPAL